MARVDDNGPLGVLGCLPSFQWLQFESGACAIRLRGKVCPCLVDTDVGEHLGPLQQLNVVNANREGTLKLVEDLDDLLDDAQLDMDTLRSGFDAHWPKLAEYPSQHGRPAGLTGTGASSASERRHATRAAGAGAVSTGMEAVWADSCPVRRATRAERAAVAHLVVAIPSGGSEAQGDAIGSGATAEG